MITRRCCGCGPGGTGTWAGPRTRPRAASTPYSANRCPAPDEITAAQATRILERVTPSGVAGQARTGLAADLLAGMRRLDEQMRESQKKLAAAVRASGTSLTDLFGVGPFVAATVIGDVAGVARFASRDRFAAYNGTAPVEVSSGNRKIYRLSLRGNRRVNHAIHMTAITQIRHAHSDGRAY